MRLKTRADSRLKQLNAKTIKQVDKSGMLDLLLDFPAQCRTAFNIAQEAAIASDKKKFDKIVFAGLGGSAIGADLVKAYLYSESKIPVNVYREYTLPACVDDSTLVFILSYSGNTEEALSSYRQAKQEGSCVIAVSSGGKLKDYAKRDNTAFIQLPDNLPPRYALGYLSIVPLCVLSKLGLIKDASCGITDAINVLEGLRNKRLSPSIGPKDNVAKSVAQKLFNKFVIVYSASMHFDVCASRFRTQLSENSKTLASSHLFPEINHGEIVGWQNPGKLFKDFAVVFLRDEGMHPSVAKSMDIVKDILREEGINAIEVWSQGKTLLSRILSLIYTGDFISYYLAILYGIDPEPVERITYLKSRLAKN